VTSPATFQVVRSNPVCRNPIDEASFKQEVLFRFTNVHSPYPKIFSNGYLLYDLHVYCAREQSFPSRFFEYIRVISHTPLEVPNASLDCSFECYHADASAKSVF